MRLISWPTLLLVSVLAIPSGVYASVLDAQVSGDRYTATLQLPGGIAADLTIRFEDAIGLDASALGVSVQQVNPLSLSLLARLPTRIGLSVPAAFPLLISIAPPASGGLAFEGVAEIELYTRNLQYSAGTPLRLYGAPAGGAFRDITDSVSGGSYRPRGSTGHFSDFMIVADLRPSATVIGDKFVHLAQLVQAHGPAIQPAARAQIEQLLSVAQSHWSGGSAAAAADVVAALEEAVASAAAAGQLPRVWRSARDLENVDGELRAAARTLRFSLNLASNQL